MLLPNFGNVTELLDIFWVQLIVIECIDELIQHMVIITRKIICGFPGSSGEHDINHCCDSVITMKMVVLIMVITFKGNSMVKTIGHLASMGILSCCML